MSNMLAIAIEGLVAALLLVTIVYCIQLNRRLQKLHADEKAMKSAVAELVAATDAAQRAIAGLKLTAREADEGLGERLRTAERFTADLASQIKSGEEVFDRLARIVGAGKNEAIAPAAGPSSDTKAVLAAAKAFAERNRPRASGLAA